MSPSETIHLRGDERGALLPLWKVKKEKGGEYVIRTIFYC